jgi:hypothetical protein
MFGAEGHESFRLKMEGRFEEYHAVLADGKDNRKGQRKDPLILFGSAASRHITGSADALVGALAALHLTGLTEYFGSLLGQFEVTKLTDHIPTNIMVATVRELMARIRPS